MTSSPRVQQALAVLSYRLHKTQQAWLVGGSVGLALRDVMIHKDPRDLDIYIDLSSLSAIHEALQEFAKHPPLFSTTEIYESTLSHYDIEGVQVELVSSFRVKASSCAYQVEVAEYQRRFATTIRIEPNLDIPIMPLAHEYVFNILRQRADRYHPIADRIKRDPVDHMPALTYILQRNTWSSVILATISSQLSHSIEHKE